MATLHLILISIWFGVLLVEFLIEILGWKSQSLLEPARLHFWIDVILEIPLVVAVLVSGAWLALHRWPLSGILWIKIIAALLAIAFNQACIVLVIRRYWRRYWRHNDPEALQNLSYPIYLTAIGVPFGLVAFYLGLRLVGG